MSIKKTKLDQLWTQEFACRLKARMNVLGVSSYDLAKTCGLTYQCIDLLLEGNTIPLAITVVKLAKGLAVEPSYLIDFEV